MNKVIKKIGKSILPINQLFSRIRSLEKEKGILQIEKGNLEAVIREKDLVINSKRNFLATRYLSGEGIEIGAAQLPVRVPDKVNVRYVDFFSSEELRRIFPLYQKLDIVDIDVIDDGEKLTKFKNGSLDFVIANHFLEHCLDPIGTIMNIYKKLRANGVIYLAIPDKRYTFDEPRPITTYKHLLDERNDKTGQKYRLEHTIEYVKTKLGSKSTEKKVNARVKELMDSGYRVHYHVWTLREMTEMFLNIAKDFELELEIEAVLKNYHEVVFILRKKPEHKPINSAPVI